MLSISVNYKAMRSKRNNLWYSLLFLVVGGLLIRLSFSLVAGATALMIAGVAFLLVAMMVFWRNFRE